MPVLSEETVCYRHRDRETGVSCSRCGRPICTDCMTSTPVGMRCPECTKEKTKVVSMRSMNATVTTVTTALIAINGLIFLASGQFGLGTGGPASQLDLNLGLFGPSIEVNHEYYRLVTSGFLHSGPLHILFNMYLLYLLGQMLEGPLGSARFALLYVVSLLAGSFGALLLAPLSLTIGASGAVFGLMGAGVVQMRARGIDPMSSPITFLLGLSLLYTFLRPGISIGAHLGGLAGGALCVAVLGAIEKRRLPAWTGYAALVLIGVASVAGAIAVSGRIEGLGL